MERGDSFTSLFAHQIDRLISREHDLSRFGIRRFVGFGARARPVVNLDRHLFEGQRFVQRAEQIALPALVDQPRGSLHLITIVGGDVAICVAKKILARRLDRIGGWFRSIIFSRTSLSRAVGTRVRACLAIA